MVKQEPKARERKQARREEKFQTEQHILPQKCHRVKGRQASAQKQLSGPVQAVLSLDGFARWKTSGSVLVIPPSRRIVSSLIHDPISRPS